MTQPALFPLPPAPAEVLEVLEVLEPDAAFFLGRMAGECGRPAAANPYPPGSRDWCEWATGWQDGREQAGEPPWEWWAYLYPERFADLTEVARP